MSGVYEFGALVTHLDCDARDVTPPGARFRQFVPTNYSFRVGGLNVPVASRDDLPLPGTTVRVTIEWDAA